MNDGVCPKCHSAKIYRGPSSEGEGLTAGSSNVLVEIMTDKTQTTLWVDTYICRACGYVEMHIANCGDLGVLPQADGWTPVA